MFRDGRRSGSDKTYCALAAVITKLPKPKRHSDLAIFTSNFSGLLTISLRLSMNCVSKANQLLCFCLSIIYVRDSRCLIAPILAPEEIYKLVLNRLKQSIEIGIDHHLAPRRGPFANESRSTRSGDGKETTTLKTKYHRRIVRSGHIVLLL